MPTRNVVLTDHQEEFIGEVVESGRYKNASEVLREGLRLVEQRSKEDAMKLVALQKLLDEGEAAITAGDLYEYTPELFDEMIAKADAG